MEAIYILVAGIVVLFALGALKDCLKARDKVRPILED